MTLITGRTIHAKGSRTLLGGARQEEKARAWLGQIVQGAGIPVADVGPAIGSSTSHYPVWLGSSFL